MGSALAHRFALQAVPLAWALFGRYGQNDWHFALVQFVNCAACECAAQVMGPRFHGPVPQGPRHRAATELGNLRRVLWADIACSVAVPVFHQLNVVLVS
jgi:hypothetical protein